MSLFQRCIAAFLPRRLVEAMEAESRAWIVRCSCGFEQSVWELGGIRYKAAGQPRWFRKCQQCSQRSWHTISRDPQRRQ